MLRRILQVAMGAKPLPRDDRTAPPPPDFTRADMDAALKSIVVPHLRSMGFKGTLPHFHRLRGDAADLLSVQFNRYGGSFVVELGRCAAEGFDFHGKHVPLAKARTSYLQERHRLGSELRVNWGDHWFDFANRDPEAIAHEVCAMLDRANLWEFIDRLTARE